MTSRTALLALLAAVLPLVGCLGEAPRDNPFDPLSPEHRDAGTVAGRVTGVYPPFEGRAGVRVHLAPLDTTGAERVVRTRADGTFRVEGLPRGSYEVRAEGDGFRTAADTLDVAAGAVAEATLQLDALPVVTAQSAQTVHIEQWTTDVSFFQLEVAAEATDPDRALDVEGAALVVEGLGFRAPLFETEPGRFRAAIDASRLPGGRVQSLLGRTLRVEVTDHAGNTALGPPLALVRVVEQTPLALRPTINEPSPPNPPTLEWGLDALPFAFTYRVDVSVVDAADVSHLVYTRSGLPPTASQHVVETPLAPGAYTWTVWVVDEAGNRSRSRPAGFRVP